MVYSATDWFEVVELPNHDVEYIHDKDNKEKIIDIIIDKSSVTVT